MDFIYDLKVLRLTVYSDICFDFLFPLELSSSDGTSIVLSDDVGQLYILSMGEGEDQTDAKYDQVGN